MQIKFIVNLLRIGSMMILVTAITETIRRAIRWLKNFGRTPKEVKA